MVGEILNRTSKVQFGIILKEWPKGLLLDKK